MRDPEERLCQSGGTNTCDSFVFLYDFNLSRKQGLAPFYPNVTQKVMHRVFMMPAWRTCRTQGPPLKSQGPCWKSRSHWGLGCRSRCCLWQTLLRPSGSSLQCSKACLQLTAWVDIANVKG